MGETEVPRRGSVRGISLLTMTNTTFNVCSLHPCAWSCCFTSAACSPTKLNTCCEDGNIPRREEGREQSGAGANLTALPGQRHRGTFAPGLVMPSWSHEQPDRADGWWDPRSSHTTKMQTLFLKALGLTLPGRCCLKDIGFHLSGGVLKHCHPACRISRNYRWKGRMEMACLVTFH